MSGRGSRDRRVAAYNRAKADVYGSHGASYSTSPFDNERQSRIYKESYYKWYSFYWKMENFAKEMKEIYGGFY